MRPSRVALTTLVVLAASTLTGCYRANIRPPFIDPANPVPHAVVFHTPQTGIYRVSLLAVDGNYALYEPSLIKNGRSGGQDVEEMRVMPGVRSVKVGCWRSGSVMSATAEMTFDLQAGHRYEVRCTRVHRPGPTWRGTEYAEFSLFDADGKPVPFTLKDERKFN